MAQIDRLREEAIERIMRTLNVDREDAENFVDISESRMFDLSEDDLLDVDITEQVTRLIRPDSDVAQ